MPDPVADILRTVQTSDRLRAAAWEAAYSSDDPDEVSNALSALPIGDSARARLWEARFADDEPSDVAAVPETPAPQPLFGAEPMTGRAFLDRMRESPGMGLPEVASEHPIATGLGLAAIGGGPALARAAMARAPLAQTAINMAGPYAKYYGVKHALLTAGMPPEAAEAMALAASGYSRGAKPAAPSAPPPAPSAPAAPAPAPPAPASAAPAPAPAAAAGPRTVSARVVGATPAPAPAEAPPAPPPVPPATPAGMSSPKTWTPEQVNEIVRLKAAGMPHDKAVDAAMAMATPSVAPASPAVSTPAVSASAAPAPAPAVAATPTAGSAPSPPPVKVLPGETLHLPPSARTRGQMSPAAIQNDLGLANRRLGANLSEAQYAEAATLVRAGRSPVEAVQDVAARPVVSAPAEPAATPAAPTQAAKGKVPKRARLTADEADEYLRLTGKGVSHEEAVAALLQQRQLAAKLGTPSPETARQRVAERNATGRWSEDK